MIPVSFLLLTLGGATWMVLDRRDGRGSALQPDTMPVARASSPVEEVDWRGAAIAQELSGDPTVREFLAAYWGSAWGEIEQELIEQGLELDGPYLFRPWEEVSAEFGSLFEFTGDKLEAHRDQKIGWPVALTPEWILQRFPIASRGDRVIGDRELAEIEDLTSEVHSKLYERFDEWGASMASALDTTWRRGAFVKVPFSTYGVPRTRGGRAFYAGARSGNGWSVRVQLYSEEYPQIEALAREMVTLRRERDALVASYLKNL